MMGVLRFFIITIGLHFLSMGSSYASDLLSDGKYFIKTYDDRFVTIDRWGGTVITALPEETSVFSIARVGEVYKIIAPSGKELSANHPTVDVTIEHPDLTIANGLHTTFNIVKVNRDGVRIQVDGKATYLEVNNNWDNGVIDQSKDLNLNDNQIFRLVPYHERDYTPLKARYMQFIGGQSPLVYREEGRFYPRGEHISADPGMGSRQGHMVFGPYVTVKTNTKYKVKFEIRSPDPKGRVATLDVIDWEKGIKYAEKTVTADEVLSDNRWTVFDFDFKTTDPTNRMEFRVYWLGSSILDVRKIELREISDIRWQDSLSERLLGACEEGNFDLVGSLLSIGADPDTQDEKGNTCLHLAAMKSNSELVRILDKYSCNPLILNQDQKTAYHIADDILDNDFLFEALAQIERYEEDFSAAEGKSSSLHLFRRGFRKANHIDSRKILEAIWLAVAHWINQNPALKAKVRSKIAALSVSEEALSSIDVLLSRLRDIDNLASEIHRHEENLTLVCAKLGVDNSMGMEGIKKVLTYFGVRALYMTNQVGNPVVAFDLSTSHGNLSDEDLSGRLLSVNDENKAENGLIIYDFGSHFEVNTLKP